MSFDVAQLRLMAPLLTLIVASMVLLLVEAFSSGQRRDHMMPLTLAVLAIALGLEFAGWTATTSPEDRVLFTGMLTVDHLSNFFDVVFLIGAAMTALLAPAYMREHRFEFGEFYALLLLATSGMMILAAATDLLSVFIGIETMSIAVYVLTGSWRRSPKSSEGAMKYFLVGAFATALLLYGIALIYGTCGTTNLTAIAAASAHTFGQPLFIFGMLFIIVAIGFKVAAVPFHMWTPDAYEGAPTPVTAFMAAGVKAAGFAAAIRLFGIAFARTELAFGASGWASILAILSAITMTFGNVAALRQENIKRLLAYSSIAHAGYLLIGVVSMSLSPKEAVGPMLFYLTAYTFTTIGAFGVVAWIGSRGDERLLLDDWAGLSTQHPAAALAMTLFMLSLGGIPPTGGFFGKLYLFRVAVGTPGLVPLVIIAVLNSVVSVYYYLRVVTTMYFREPGREQHPLASSGVTAALVIAALGTVVIGVVPNWLIEVATTAGLGR